MINTLDRRDWLEGTLDGLDDQEFVDFEVVVVNGPSSDGTAEMLAARPGRHRVVHCDVASLGVSRNAGIRHAACPLVAFIDDDAVPEPTWLSELVTRFESEGVGAVGGPVFDVPTDRVEWKICTCTRAGEPNTDSPGPLDRYNVPGADPLPYLAGCNMAFRRSVLREVGGFNPMLAYGYDDVEVCARVVDRGYRIAYADDALVRHFRAPSAVRDESMQLRDPYSISYARTQFALQWAQPSQDVGSLGAAVKTAMMWHAPSADELGGSSTQHYEARIDTAISDALADRVHGRPWVDVGDRPRLDFVPYLG
ncbi:MAG: glycosyltransferase [Ilumatobacter sp.]|nr:glycosyltransferase [Ilumatobacter sp.]